MNFNVASPANALMQGMQYGNQMKQMQQGNQLQDAFQQSGGVVNGDVLSQMTPDQAYKWERREVEDGFDDKKSGLQIETLEVQLGNLREKGKQAAEAHAAKLTAAERVQEANQLRSVLTSAGAAYRGGEPALQAWVQQNAGALQEAGIDPAAVTMDALPTMIAPYKGVLDALEQFDDVFGQDEVAPQSSLGKIQADINSGILPENTPLRAGQQNETIYDAAGNVIVQRGGAPKMTVDAAKNTGFLIRMQESNQVLDSLEDQGTRFGQQNLDMVPFGLGNYGRDPEFQRFDQARRDFVNAILRRESGAVISDQEFDNADKQYFPVPGDTPEVIEQKRRNRQTAIAGIRVGAGDGAGYADAQRLPAQPQPAPQPAPQPQPQGMPSVADISSMSDAELDAFILQLGQQ